MLTLSSLNHHTAVPGAEGHRLSHWCLTEIKSHPEEMNFCELSCPGWDLAKGRLSGLNRRHLRGQNSVLVGTGTCHLPLSLLLYISEILGGIFACL